MKFRPNICGQIYKFPIRKIGEQKNISKVSLFLQIFNSQVVDFQIFDKNCRFDQNFNQKKLSKILIFDKSCHFYKNFIGNFEL